VKGWCESGNESPGSTKCGEFRNYIRNLSPLQEEFSFIHSVSFGRFISSFGLSMTGTSAHIKEKVHPRTDHEGPDGEYRYNHTLSLTSALDGGGWSTPHLGRFTAGKDPEVGWASGPVWTGAENLVYSGIRSPERLARNESIHKERPLTKLLVDDFLPRIPDFSTKQGHVRFVADGGTQGHLFWTLLFSTVITITPVLLTLFS